MPARKLPKSAGNHHSTRHESGLAPPAKRIDKRRSDTNLNGHVSGKADLPQTPPDTAEDLKESPMTLPATPDEPTQPLAHVEMHAAPPTRSTDGRARTSSETSQDGHDNEHCGLANGALESPTSPEAPRKAGCNAAKSSSVQQTKSLLTVATTILSACPLRDVLAILIILLQLPPTVLTIVNFLFTTLTIVPPTTGTSISALPSLHEMFQAQGGSPSLFTVLVFDVVVYVLWTMLAAPAQNIFLDFAQAVVAISLGGAAAGNWGNGLMLSAVIIFMSHTIRYKPIRQGGFHLLWMALSKAGFNFLDNPPPTATIDHSPSYISYGFPRSMLGVHILTQAVVQQVRRYLQQRPRDSAPNLTTGKQLHPEPAASHQHQRNSSSNAENNVDPASNPSSDGRPPGPPPTAKEKTMSSGKKKRKQATMVRSRQPFWAAIASTKISVMKEMEQSQTSADLPENSSDHLNPTIFGLDEDRVWILALSATEISFGASLVKRAKEVVDGDAHGGKQVSISIDKSKPFFVRVNGADWSSTRIKEGGKLGESDVDLWTGNIYGLAALSNYYCEFVRTTDLEVIHTASLITPAAPDAEQTSAVGAPAHQTLRPSSPSTTLKLSISAAESDLQKDRDRLKRNRKDHKSAITSLRKDNDNLRSRLESSGGDDDKARKRAKQLEQSIKRTEETTTALIEEIATIGDIPAEDVTLASDKQSAWRKEREAQKAAQKDLDGTKSEADANLNSHKSDIQSALKKRDRLQTRQNKLTEQYESILSASNQEDAARHQRLEARAMVTAQRKAQENGYLRQIANMESNIQDLRSRSTMLQQQISHLESASAYGNGAHMSVPTTPEGPLPGTMNGSSAHPSPAFPNFAFPVGGAPHFPTTNGFHSTTTGQNTTQRRVRSSSLLSNVSGFSEPYEDSPTTTLANVNHTSNATLPPYNLAVGQLWDSEHRKGSSGSGSASANGSGSGSANGSQRDEMSPVPRKSGLLASANTWSGIGNSMVGTIGSGRVNTG